MTSSDVQKACGLEWSELNLNDRNVYDEKAKETSQNSGGINYITNSHYRKTTINQSIKHIRDQVKLHLLF